MRLQEEVEKLLETPLYSAYRGYSIHEEGDKHLWDLLVELSGEQQLYNKEEKTTQ